MSLLDSVLTAASSASVQRQAHRPQRRDVAITVWCHSNRLDGKGMGTKARDDERCYGCAGCHVLLDGGYANSGWERNVVELYFDRARHQRRPPAPEGTALMACTRIKMRSNLWSDPRLDRLCGLSGQVEPMVIGGRYWLWTSADQHAEGGFMPGLSAAAIDRKCGVAGLGEALLAVGWIELVAALPGSVGNASGIRINHFNEHNGATAKKGW